jgi:hypothetical protein
MLPFVSDWRKGQRLGATLRRSKEDNQENSKAGRNLLTEFTGPLSSTALMALIGGTGGAILGDGDSDAIGAGAAIGAGGSAGVHALAAIAALLRRRRTRGEQSEHDRESQMLDNSLLPGAAAYGMFKRIGSTGKPYA